MARRLGAKTNTMIIQDPVGGGEVHLKYRMPTNQERISYQERAYNFRRNKLTMKTYEARLEFGIKILTGFRSGDFEVETDGQWNPISSNTSDANFYPRWHEYLCQEAPDLISALGGAVFDPATISEGESDSDEGDPSTKNSRNSYETTLREAPQSD